MTSCLLASYEVLIDAVAAPFWDGDVSRHDHDSKTHSQPLLRQCTMVYNSSA